MEQPWSMQPSPIEKLAERYNSNPIVKGFVQMMIPGGAVIDEVISSRLQRVQEERMRVFFDELADGTIELTPELVESDDFLHCYFATAKAASNTRRSEKIRLLGRLLKSAMSPNSLASTDEYEEFLVILDDMSFRELYILSILDKYQNKYPKVKREDGQLENDFQRARKFWDEFSTQLEHELEISAANLHGVLTRLNRTGCFETLRGYSGATGATGDEGFLTPSFYRLKQLIEDHDSNII
jgi:hypothetical protein